ncbi:MAG: pyridoxamine 5'-phosphate oxidase family protein [Clostridiales bacterium]|nr:pyridoxamine 5'-phosphate oxidase family protein [Clostridiales bacterium]
MFREMTRKNKQLPMEECLALLKTEKRGVLSVLGDDGYPYGVPMNHFYNEEDGCLYFHCGRQKSHRNDALARCGKASFCVYDKGWREEGDWALNVKSVIVFGWMEILEDWDTIVDISTRLSRKFSDDEAYIRTEIERSGRRTLLLKLTPEHITGKKIKES